MKHIAHSSTGATVVRFPKTRPGEIDLERILWDRSYRQRFLDELQALQRQDMPVARHAQAS